MWEDRIQNLELRGRVVSADEAASWIHDGMTVGISGFTRAGDAKVVPLALAERVKREAKPLKINLWTGASVAEEVDDTLVRAGIVARRMPFQSNARMRDAINQGEVMYVDAHLSEMVEWVRAAELGPLDVAIIEATAILPNGGIVPSTSVGNSPTFAYTAQRIIVELNMRQSPLLLGVHDVFVPGPRPHRSPIPLTDASDRIGAPYIAVNPRKIAGIVITEREDHFAPLPPVDDDMKAIAGQLVEFFLHEVRRGRLPKNLHPLQSGVGALANGVLSAFVDSPFEHLQMYSEVLQDGVFDLMDAGKMDIASGCAITVSPERAGRVFRSLDRYRNRLILRPQEISNHPEVIRRLGVIAMNTALEADIYGNVNSTHIAGTQIMNGIGGSGDFARNALLSVFMTKSTAKHGHVSSIVPMVSHVDHTEHDVDIIVTERGLADLRGLAPRERARLIIDRCAHPAYRELLRDYYEEAVKRGGHTPHVLEQALSWHVAYQRTGSMRQA
ncbi:MAG: acetyl-CoA hydrolase/transferase family protein [Thermoflavifilum sp.]|nr:acetyl-CoA hydrolase/transferase family protein [Thermoflavifilum sp.]MCL6513497.1 acetyl-CoA hydrolase/transferase family protein [Alicyclobacillus sp.]